MNTTQRTHLGCLSCSCYEVPPSQHLPRMSRVCAHNLGPHVHSHQSEKYSIRLPESWPAGLSSHVHLVWVDRLHAADSCNFWRAGTQSGLRSSIMQSQPASDSLHAMHAGLISLQSHLPGLITELNVHTKRICGADASFPHISSNAAIHMAQGTCMSTFGATFRRRFRQGNTGQTGGCTEYCQDILQASCARVALQTIKSS